MKQWLRARFHAHTFHYRMPETAAINAVNPVIPSPLTVKLALVAALLRARRVDDARRLAGALHNVEVKIRPPARATVFRALMRYVRPPKKDPERLSDHDAGTGSAYRISPHYREYALWGGVLEVFLGVPQDLADAAADALSRIDYLGARDSQVSCEAVDQVAADEVRAACAMPHDVADAETADLGILTAGGVVVQLADLIKKADLEQLLPGARRRTHYAVKAYRLPGVLRARAGVREYHRDAAPGPTAVLRGS